MLDRGQCEAYLGVGSPPVPTRPVYFPGKLKQTSNPTKRDNKWISLETVSKFSLKYFSSIHKTWLETRNAWKIKRAMLISSCLQCDLILVNGFWQHTAENQVAKSQYSLVANFFLRSAHCSTHNFHPECSNTDRKRKAPYSNAKTIHYLLVGNTLTQRVRVIKIRKQESEKRVVLR